MNADESAPGSDVVIIAVVRANRALAQFALHSREKLIRGVAIRSLLPFRIGGVINRT